MKFFFQKQTKPIDDKWIIRILLMLTIVLAITAGYYNAALISEQKKYLKLEDMYVRVRTELGRDATQNLIDISREKEINN
ncbi:hypothetical protein KA017_01880 [Candidatus Woesebacteria bacterium]|nr:hypothetical protein [Candidatus Woesebacteria bacterium]